MNKKRIYELIDMGTKFINSLPPARSEAETQNRIAYRRILNRVVFDLLKEEK